MEHTVVVIAEVGADAGAKSACDWSMSTTEAL
jgi:hypothetical protein